MASIFLVSKSSILFSDDKIYSIKESMDQLVRRFRLSSNFIDGK